MNYDQKLNQIYEAIKADKSVVQPWRNKAVARLQEAQAFIRMGQTTSNAAPLEPPPMQFASPVNACICQPDMPPRKDCLMHGNNNFNERVG